MTVRLDSKFSEQINTCEFRKALNLAYGQGGLKLEINIPPQHILAKSKGGLIIEGGVSSSEYGNWSHQMRPLFATLAWIIVLDQTTSLVPRPPPFFVLRFVFSIIHGSRRASVYYTERKPKEQKNGGGLGMRLPDYRTVQ